MLHAPPLYAFTTRDAPAVAKVLNAIEFTIAQQFEIESMSRAIDGTTDVAALQALAKQLLQAWHVQRAATNWAIRQRA